MSNINIKFKVLFLCIIAFSLLIIATYYYYNVSSNPETTISNDIKKEVNLREIEVMDFSNNGEKQRTKEEVKPGEYYLDLGGGHFPDAQKVTGNEIYRWVTNIGPSTGFGNTSYCIEERQTEGGLYYVRIYSEDQLFLQKIHTVFHTEVESLKTMKYREHRRAVMFND